MEIDTQVGAKVDKERYSTPALGGKLRGGGMQQKDDVTNIFCRPCFNHFGNSNMVDYFSSTATIWFFMNSLTVKKIFNQKGMKIVKMPRS